jgi:hypothetical protein
MLMTLSPLSVGVGLLVGVLAVAYTAWVTRLASRKLQAKFPRAEAAQWALYLLMAALIYVGFAHAAATPWPRTELLGVLGYGALAAAGFFVSTKLLALGWLLHALWDTVLHGPHTPFVPDWYRWACLSFDVLSALWISRRV